MSGRDAEPAGLPVLPATVAAEHLRACAAGLVEATSTLNARHGLGEVGALAEVIGALVDGQRDLATTLANLADRITEGEATGALAAAPRDDLLALTEILLAAGSAAGHTADALEQSSPAVRVLLDSVGSDTRLR